MLKTNSRKARENLRRYIMENFTPEDYTDTPPETWSGIAAFILETFRSESYYAAYHPEGKAFGDWTRGLPSVLDCRYWYNRPAVDDLGDILEQTAEERSRYTEDEAGERLTTMIYMELLRGARAA